MDSFDGFFTLIALVIAVLAWMSSRKTRRRANDQLNSIELQLKTARANLKKQAEQIAALEARSFAPAAAPSGIDPLAALVVAPAAIDPAASINIVVATETIGTPSISVAGADGAAKPPEAAPLEGKIIEAIAAPAPAADPAKPVLPQVAAKSEDTLEEKIALVWFTRIGALAMLVGVAFFFKYASDNGWIGPAGRVALGVLAGLGVLVFAEATGARTKALYLQVLIGVGLSFLFVSAYASGALYHLVPNAASFAAIAVITLLGGALSIRHRGEGVLILSLLAGFLCPILLSTGKDQPLALFAYLLVLTGLGFATSVRMGFRYATWLGLAGTALLYSGWYSKFFDLDAPVHQKSEDGEDVTIVAGGAYFPLGARIVPLLGALLFLSEWLGVWWFARKSQHKQILQPLAFLVTALLLAHAAFCALLYDKPIVLGFTLAALGLLSSFVLGLEEKRQLLALPLLAAFGVLLRCAQDSQSSPNGMLAVLGITFIIYAGGIGRGELARATKPSERTLQLLCGAGVCLAIVAAVLLLELHPMMFAFVLAILSLAYAALAAMVMAPVVATGAIVLSFVGLAIAEPHTGATTPLFLVAAGLWSAIYFASTAWDLLSRKLEATPPRLFTISAAGLGFAAMVFVNSGEKDWLLQAIALILIGALDLAVGAALLKTKARRPATILLGQALGLFAAAAATIFTGATITIVWAVLAATVAVLAAADEDPYWLAGAVLLFTLTVIRALDFDLQIPDQQRAKFFESLGAEGRLEQRFLFNQLSLAFIGTGAALLVSARALGSKTAAGFKQCAFGFVTVAHLLLLLVCVYEASHFYFAIPPVPAIPLFPPGEYRDAVTSAISGQTRSFSMVVTVVMSLYATLLVAIGFARRNQPHRFLGLGLFAITLAKLVLWDVWHLPRIEQMVVLVAMGGLLLGSSYLYARFGKRLVTLIRDGELAKGAVKPGAAALLIFLAATSFSSPARAFDQTEMLRIRTISGVNESGLHKVEIDPALYTNIDSELTQLRIADSSGAEVPYLIREIAPVERLIRHDATVVDPISNDDGSTSAILDLGQRGLKHSEVELQIDGSDFLRRTRVEISNDEVKFSRLAEGAMIYQVSSSESTGASTSISYPVSDARYLRITILPGADHQLLQITAAHLSYVTVESKPPVRTLDAGITTLPRKPEATTTSLIVDLGATGVPIDSLQLEISTPLFERRVSVRASDDPRQWSAVASGLLYRSSAAQGLSLRFSPTRQRYFRVDIQDGNDPPLSVTAAHATYRPQELIFRSASAGPLTMFLGNPHLAAPVYDLAAVVAREGNALPILPAQLGPISANPTFHPPAIAPPPPPPLSEQYKTLIIVVLGLLLAGLALWTVRLLRASGNDPGEPPVS